MFGSEQQDLTGRLNLPQEHRSRSEERHAPLERTLSAEHVRQGSLTSAPTPLLKRNGRSETILYLENCEDDYLLMKMAIRKVEPTLQLEWLRCSEELLARLCVPRPRHLLLLDVKLHGENGFDILKALTQSSMMPRLPIFLFSGTGIPPRMQEAIGSGAAGFIAKPRDFQGLCEVVAMLVEYFQNTTPATAQQDSWSREA